MSKENPEKQENSGDDIRDEKGRFKKGKSGNPDGRPKFSLVSILKEKLQERPPGEEKTTYASKLIRVMLDKAIEEGSDSQIKNILNYVDGLPKQTIDHGLQKEVENIKVEINRGTESESD